MKKLKDKKVGRAFIRGTETIQKLYNLFQMHDRRLETNYGYKLGTLSTTLCDKKYNSYEVTIRRIWFENELMNEEELENFQKECGE